LSPLRRLSRFGRLCPFSPFGTYYAEIQEIGGRIIKSDQNQPL
jgi:hypothetical protein